MNGLVFPDHAGCAGTHGARRCLTAPIGTVKHQDGRHTVRVFVCDAHAVGQLDPRPLTEHDRAELRRRRQRVRPRRDPFG